MVGAKPAVQERSRKTRKALLDAMDQLLRQQEFSELSVAKLAKRAGVSPASIYQRFSNQDALISILVELYMQRVEAWQEGAAPPPAGSSLRDMLIHMGATSWDMVEELGHVIRPAYLMSQLRPELVGPDWDRLMARARAGFAHMLEHYRAELGGVDPAVLADPIAMHANMMLVARLLHWQQAGGSHLPQDRDGFGVMIADFALGYVERTARGAAE